MGYLLSLKTYLSNSGLTSIKYSPINSRIMVCGSNVYLYSFNGTSLSLEDYVSDSTYDIAYDGTYYYVVTQSGYLKAYDSTLVAVGSVIALASAAYHVMCDSSGFIHVSRSDGYISTYTFNGTLFSLVTSYRNAVALSIYTNHLVYDGTYFYKGFTTAANNMYIEALAFNGISFTYLNSILTLGNYRDAVIHDGTGVVVGVRNFMERYTFNGSAFTCEISSAILGGNSLCFDGQFYYTIDVNNADEPSIKAYEIVGSEFVLVSKIVIGVGTLFRNLCTFGGGYIFSINPTTGPYVYKMGLVAQFSADKVSGTAPLTVTFTAS